MSTVQGTQVSGNLNEVQPRLVNRARGCGGDDSGALRAEIVNLRHSEISHNLCHISFPRSLFLISLHPPSALFHQRGEHVLNSFSHVQRRVALQKLFSGWGGGTNFSVSSRYGFDIKKRECASDVFGFLLRGSSGPGRSRRGFVASEKRKTQRILLCCIYCKKSLDFLKGLMFTLPVFF